MSTATVGSVGELVEFISKRLTANRIADDSGIFWFRVHRSRIWNVSPSIWRDYDKDEHRSYWGLTDYPHAFVQHGNAEYVVGAVHTCTIDGFWSLLKRGIMGTFHKVSAKYLPLYVAEFTFLYNNRNNPGIFGEAVGRC